MLIADIPNTPPSTPAVVMVAEANSGQRVSQDGHVLGVCDVVNINEGGQLNASPVTQANAYFRTHDAKIDFESAKISVIQQPKHGHLEPNSRGDWRFAVYVTNGGYLELAPPF